MTRLSSGAGIAEGDQSVPAYVQALLEQTAESLDNLQRTMTNAEGGRHSSNQTFVNLAERLATLTDQMRSEQDLMVKLIESQMEMKPLLQKLAEDRGGVDKTAQTHLRNMDLYLSQLLDATTRGQDQLVTEIRNELKLVARTIAASLDKRRD